MDTTLAVLFGMPGWAEILVLLGVGVLIFGRRLPEVGKNIGRGIVEFKKGLRGIEDDMDQAVHEDTRRIEHDDPPPHIESKPETEVADATPSADTSEAEPHSSTKTGT